MRSRRERTPEPGLRRRGAGAGAGVVSDGAQSPTASAAKASKTNDDAAAADETEVPHHLAAATPGNIQEEGFIDAFYQPRSFSGLLVLLGLVAYVTVWEEEALVGERDRVKTGLLLASAAFLLYCVMQLRDGHLLRPHPAVWRLVHGTGLLYFLLLVYLSCQDLAGIHQFLQLFDSTVGPQEAEQSYGGDCRIYVPNAPDPWVNVKGQFFDRFTVAHFLGWTIKALILRDWTLMWASSVLFEILETTFQHMYPNFNECWWDHLLLDIFGCNLAGMVFGMWLVKNLGTHHFNWTGHGVGSIDGYVGKMQRVALQFTPRSFETYRWQVFSSWRRFAVIIYVLIILLLGELNAFFLKSTFGIPIKSDINLYRLGFWTFMTYMATFEFHRFAEGKSRRVGVNSWLAGSLVSLEFLLVLKHTVRQRLFTWDQVMPASYIVYGWVATLFLVLLTAAVKSVRKMLLIASGAQEVFADPHTGKKASGPPPAADVAAARKLRSSSLDLIEAASPGAMRYIQVGRVLDQAFQLLTFAIPAPLLIVLAMDCYRTTLHPPPVPGQTPGW